MLFKSWLFGDFFHSQLNLIPTDSEFGICEWGITTKNIQNEPLT